MVNYIEFIQPVFDALKELDDTTHNQEVIQLVMKKQGISESDLVLASSGGESDLRKRIGYACTCLKENGYVTYPSWGFWSLTDKGRTARQIDPEELEKNYERIRSSRRALRQQERLGALSVGPVRILTKEQLFQPVVDALHALDGSGDKRAIAEQIIVSEQLIDPSLLEEDFLNNSGRISQLYRNIASAQTALKKAALISNRGSTWFLNPMVTPGYTVDPHFIRRSEERDKASRRLAREKERKDLINTAKEVLREEIQAEASTIDGEAQSGSHSVSASFPLYLEVFLKHRRANPSPNSYTSSLFSAGPARIAQKVGEEALEVIAALHETRERQVSEIADLFFHTLVLLVELNIPLEEVLAELQRRHEKRN